MFRAKLSSIVKNCCSKAKNRKRNHPVNFRNIATTTVGPSKDKLKIESNAPEEIRTDWIGPPDQHNNLRPVKFYIPADETQLERDFREWREDTQRFNQAFWSQHNNNFTKSKEAFIHEKLAELRETAEDGSPRKLTADQLSVFYKKFLDDNYEHHCQYNREWYRRNMSLLWPALKVTWNRLVNGRHRHS